MMQVPNVTSVVSNLNTRTRFLAAAECLLQLRRHYQDPWIFYSELISCLELEPLEFALLTAP